MGVIKNVLSGSFCQFGEQLGEDLLNLLGRELRFSDKACKMIFLSLQTHHRWSCGLLAFPVERLLVKRALGQKINLQIYT